MFAWCLEFQSLSPYLYTLGMSTFHKNLKIIYTLPMSIDHVCVTF